MGEVELEEMDWQNVKTEATKLLREHKVGAEINQLILNFVNKKLKKYNGKRKTTKPQGNDPNHAG